MGTEKSNELKENKAELKKQKREKVQVKYTKGEERFNWITHLAGLVLAAAASVTMIIKSVRGYQAGQYDASGIVAAALFSFGLLAVYAISMSYHLTKYGTAARTLMRKFDHCTITVLIAGSYMPYMLIGLAQYGLNQPADFIWGVVIASIVLAMAVAVIVLNIVGIQKFRYLTLAFYIAMGWMIIIRIYSLYKAIGGAALLLLLGGGIAYTTGVLFYKMKKIPFGHGIFHIFVIAGSALMWASVYFFIL